jgi:prolyl oligopeptidase
LKRSRTEPPRARRANVEEHLGGLRVRDPYRWMEEGGPELERWVAAQHRHTAARLASWPAQEQLRSRFQALLDLGSVRTPIVRGDRYFYCRRRKGNQLAVLCVRTGLRGAERVLLDPHRLRDDDSLGLAGVYVSPDGKLAVCKLVQRATSRAFLRVLDLDSGRLLGDTIPADLYPLARTRPGVSAALWEPDGAGFYYTRIPEATPVHERRYHQKVYFHRIGDRWSDDELVFGEGLKKEQTPYPRLSPDGRYLIVEVLDLSGDTARTEVFVRDRRSPDLGFRALVTGHEALFECRVHRGVLYLKTNLDAPHGRIVTVALASPDGDRPAMLDVVPEGKEVLRSWALVGDRMFVEGVRNVSSRLHAYDLEGCPIQELALPGIGSLGGLRGEPEGSELFFSFSSFLSPEVIYRVRLDELGPERWIGAETRFDASRFELNQVWFESSDRTRVPMFIVGAKGAERNSENPVVVQAYGGFNESKLPCFDPSIIPFLESGGVYALVNVRGGGELGEDWHRAGVRAEKQNAFDDFIAAAQWLIEAGYTNPARLGCYGWSNGGLLVNAVAQQRPDLWRAVVAGAPVADMARFHTGAGGRNWIADYGSPDDPEDARALLRYSPYHNMPESIAAPAVLIWVPREDDRVAPWHGYKMLAQWQYANVGPHPALLCAEADSGHRGAVAAGRTSSRYTDIWTFFFTELGVDWHDRSPRERGARCVARSSEPSSPDSEAG